MPQGTQTIQLFRAGSVSNDGSKTTLSDCLLQVLARAAAANMCSTFNAVVVHYSMISHCYYHFFSGDIAFGIKPRFGRKSIVDEQELQYKY